MSDDKLELNRRRVLGGLATIGLASAGAGAGTMAYFSDQEKSSGNTVSAGTVDLGSASQGSVTINSQPGDTGSGRITATYNGSISPVEVDVSMKFNEPTDDKGNSAEETEPTDNDIGDGSGGVSELSASEFAQRVEVTEAKAQVDDGSGWSTTDNLLDSVDKLGTGDIIHATSTKSVDSGDPGTANVTLNDLKAALDASAQNTGLFGDVATGDMVGLKLGLKFDTASKNDAQADGVDVTVTFDAQQKSEDLK